MNLYERLITPREHLHTLIEPAGEQIRGLLSSQAESEHRRTLIAGRPLGEWRADLRQGLGLSGPVIVTGHQAEFFHAGVFAKTIAAHVLANQAGGTPVFLTVDSDLPKLPYLAVPEIAAVELRRVEVEIPGCDPQLPEECQPRASREQWLEFFVRVASIYEHYDMSLLRCFTDAWLACGEERVAWCDAMARGRRAIEETLGLPGVRELRISQLCGMPAFRAFAAHLITNAERLASDYNAAQAAYRQRHRVRSVNRPVPPLATRGGRTEAPLWVFREGGPRERLYVAQQDDRIEFFAGRESIGVMAAADLGAPATMDTPWPLEQAGWRIRPRATTLAAFARLFVADLFIHGIGGAKYDEITDDCLHRFLGFAPPPFCCVSATLHLPLPRTGVRGEDLAEARRQSRDIRFNPQRYLEGLPVDLLQQRDEMISRSDALSADRSTDRGARRAVFEEIRRLNEHLLEHDPWRAADLDQRYHALADRQRLDHIAFDREYFVALHFESTLRELVSRIRDRLGATSAS